MSSYLPAVAASLLPNLGGWGGALITSFLRSNNGREDPWYDNLKRPSWCPPNWVFGPVWTGLYTSMGYASYLVWKNGGGFQGDSKIPLILYGTQLAVNCAWVPIFFGKHSITGGLVDITILYGCAVACGYEFYKIDPMAGYLFIPYIAWLTLATSLTYCIWRDNPKDSSKIKELKD